MRTLALIQARIDSARLPGKALMDIGGKPMIARVAERVLALGDKVEGVCVVCPAADAHAIWRALGPLNVSVLPTQVVPVRMRKDGSVAAWDVLGAFVAAVEAWDAAHPRKRIKAVLRVTGDCPLWLPVVGREVLAMLDSCRYEDYFSYATADTTCSGWPDGTDAECVETTHLRRLETATNRPLDREHVTRAMRLHVVPSVCENPHGDWGDWPPLSVNTEADLRRVRYLSEAVGTDWSATALEQAMAAWTAKHGEA